MDFRNRLPRFTSLGLIHISKVLFSQERVKITVLPTVGTSLQMTTAEGREELILKLTL